MFTIIGGDGKEYGPVTADQLRAWLAAGRANLETQARAAGSTEWRRLGDFPEFNGSAGAPPPLAASVPSAPAGPVDAKAYADDLIARAAPLDVFDCLGRAFNLWTKHFLPLVGVTLLVMLAQGVAGMIPLVGILSGFLLNGVFYGGLYYYYLGHLRGQRREVGDAFAGFSKAFVPLMLATLFTSLLTLALAMPFFFGWILFFVKMVLEGARDMPPLPSGGMLFLTLIGIFVVAYISVAWTFTFALVIDQGLSPWNAMEVSRRVITKQWFRVFFVLLLAWFLMMLGLIGLIIGVIFTAPILFCALICAYEDLCRPPPAATAAGAVAGTPTLPTVS